MNVAEVGPAGGSRVGGSPFGQSDEAAGPGYFRSVRNQPGDAEGVTGGGVILIGVGGGVTVGRGVGDRLGSGLGTGVGVAVRRGDGDGLDTGVGDGDGLDTGVGDGDGLDTGAAIVGYPDGDAATATPLAPVPRCVATRAKTRTPSRPANRTIAGPSCERRCRIVGPDPTSAGAGGIALSAWGKAMTMGVSGVGGGPAECPCLDA
jgi:hypothetical protein